MNALIESKLDDLTQICRERHVRRLALFGSALDSSFNPASSDVDLLVEFEPLTPSQHADSYFGLQEDLEQLLGLPVDLVEPGPIRNPYFKRAVEETQVLLYAAA